MIFALLVFASVIFFYNSNMENFLIIFAASYLYLFVVAATLAYFLALPRQIKKSFMLLAIVALPTIYLCAQIAAVFFFDPRPFVVGHFIPLIPHAPDNGFPSDHALLTSAIASVVYPFSKKFSLILWLLAFAIGAARVMAGIHHFMDIFGAMAIAAVVTFVLNLSLKNQKFVAYLRS